MILYTMSGVKNALLLLEDTTGTAIFSNAYDIWTDNPEKHKSQKDASPIVSANHPIVCLFPRKPTVKRLGYSDFRERIQRISGSNQYMDNYLRVSEVTIPLEIHILAATPAELLGTETWVGYIEQIHQIIYQYREMPGRYWTECSDVITWDMLSFERPVELTFSEMQVHVGVVHTKLEGSWYYVDSSPEITQVVPTDTDGAFP